MALCPQACARYCAVCVCVCCLQALDRWEQHTQHCPYCKSMLGLVTKLRGVCTALLWLRTAAGAAAAALAAMSVTPPQKLATWLGVCVAVGVSSWMARVKLGDVRQCFYLAVSVELSHARVHVTRTCLTYTISCSRLGASRSKKV